MNAKSKIPLILQIFIFLIPMNVYVIGDGIGTGIQWLFFRYHVTNSGNSIVFLHREIGFVVSGLLTGKSAIASVLWAAGAILVIAATILVIYSLVKTDPAVLKKTAFINIAAAILFLLSVFVQYGILFHGPAGIAIPFGIPVLLIIAWWQYRISCTMDDDSNKDAENSGNENPESR
jgi:hypothetical protein